MVPMTHEPPPALPEALDDWDGEDEEPVRRPSARLIGLLALLVIVAIGVAVVFGGTQRAAVVITPPPTVAVSMPSAVPTPDATSYVTVDASAGPIEVPVPVPQADESIPSTAAASPLIVSLLDPEPRTESGLVAFRVQICVSPGSAALDGGKVTVSRGSWRMWSKDLNTVIVSETRGTLSPEFPASASLGAGECVSGYVCFPMYQDVTSLSLSYDDARLSWTWRIR